jgi:hypothetical protein
VTTVTWARRSVRITLMVFVFERRVKPVPAATTTATVAGGEIVQGPVPTIVQGSVHELVAGRDRSSSRRKRQRKAA